MREAARDFDRHAGIRVLLAAINVPCASVICARDGAITVAVYQACTYIKSIFVECVDCGRTRTCVYDVCVRVVRVKYDLLMFVLLNYISAKDL